jgi:predicted dehydrogenase
MTRVAVVGIGVWGRQLIRVLNDLAEVVVCCNRGDTDGQEWVRHRYPAIRVGSSSQEAIADPAVEAVVIATPIATHAPLAIASLSAGKHVFVEKPLGTTAAEAWRAVEAAEAARRTLFVGHTFLFDACFEALHAIARDDAVERIDLSWLKYGTFGEPLVWNLLPHEVALAMWLADATPSLTVLERASGPTPLDRLRIRLDFGARGPAGSIEIDRIHEDDKTKSARLETRSGVTYLWRDGDLYRIGADDREERLMEHSEEALVREVRAFLDGVETGRPTRSDGPFGASVVDVIEPIATWLQEASPVAGHAGR